MDDKKKRKTEGNKTEITKAAKKPFVEPEIEVIQLDGKDFISMVDNSRDDNESDFFPTGPQ